MTIFDFMKKIDPYFQEGDTVDTFKYGDTSKEAKKIAVCLTATPNVLKEAKKWDADLIITHEPTYYEHTDNFISSDIADLKKALVEECDIPICRYHDHMHFTKPLDLIADGFLREMKWEGSFDGHVGYTLDAPKTPLEIAKDIENKLGIKHVRIVGARDGKISKIGLFLGHRSENCWGDFKRNRSFELAIGGEWCEWHDGEMIRDAAQFGKQLSAIILGHAASEKFGMKALAEDLNREFASQSIKVRYFECEDLFTYTD